MIDSQRFGEIAFCAITADEQVKGYGTRLMNHLKQFAREEDGLTHFLTYADNNAVGYFIKQVCYPYIRSSSSGLLLLLLCDKPQPSSERNMLRYENGFFGFEITFSNVFWEKYCNFSNLLQIIHFLFSKQLLYMLLLSLVTWIAPVHVARKTKSDMHIFNMCWELYGLCHLCTGISHLCCANRDGAPMYITQKRLMRLRSSILGYKKMYYFGIDVRKNSSLGLENQFSAWQGRFCW